MSRGGFEQAELSPCTKMQPSHQCQWEVLSKLLGHPVHSTAGFAVDQRLLWMDGEGRLPLSFFPSFLLPSARCPPPQSPHVSTTFHFRMEDPSVLSLHKTLDEEEEEEEETRRWEKCIADSSSSTTQSEVRLSASEEALPDLQGLEICQKFACDCKNDYLQAESSAIAFEPPLYVCM